MHAMIAEVRRTDLMTEIDHETAFLANHGKIVRNGNAPSREPHTMIRA
jgi:hypothetical protein